jgi:hypothetical protein
VLARSSSSGRPLGVTVLSGACLLGSAWSFGAAALPGFFYGYTIPGYPPLVMLQWQIVHGEGRFVGVGLSGQQQSLAAAGIGIVLAIVGLALWKQFRLAPYAFLAVLWAGTVTYGLSFWRSPFGGLARQAFTTLTPGMRLIVQGNLAAAAVLMLLVTGYVWRRRARVR